MAGKTKLLCTKIEPELENEIDRKSAMFKISKSKLVRMAVMHFLDINPETLQTNGRAKEINN